MLKELIIFLIFALINTLKVAAQKTSTWVGNPGTCAAGTLLTAPKDSTYLAKALSVCSYTEGTAPINGTTQILHTCLSGPGSIEISATMGQRQLNKCH